MDKVLKKTFYWLPAIIWMLVIFYFSSRTRVVLFQDQKFDITYKFFHVIEYAVLYLLLFRGFFLSAKKRFSSKIYLYTFFITLIYAISDETHQLFVPTREGALRDVFIDAIGMTIMYTLIKSQKKLVKKII